MQKKTLEPDEKNYQHQLQQERELKNLIKQYFVLDKASSLNRISLGNVLAKKKRVIDLFKKEHINILDDLTRAKARKKTDEKEFDKLTSLLNEKTLSQNHSNKLKEHLIEFKNEHKSVEKQVLELRGHQVTDAEFEKRIWDAAKTVEKLENQLETQMRKFGTICCKNRKLRQEIDYLLWDRSNFMVQWHKLIEKLNSGKQFMLDLIEQATIAYNQREEWCTKLQYLRTKALQDLTTHRDEMRDFKRTYDHVQKLRDFLQIKSQKRVMTDLKIKEALRREKIEDELVEKLQNYQTILQNVEQFTDQKNVKIIARNFVKHEEFNLTKFQFVIEMIKEMESVNDRLSELQFDIDEKRALYKSRDLQQKNALEQLEQKLETMKNVSEQTLNDFQQTENIFQQLLKGVLELFHITKCDTDPLLQLLADNGEIKFYNCKLFLEILERKVHVLLVNLGYRDSKRKPNDFRRFLNAAPEVLKIYSIDKVVETSPCALCVEHEMVSDVIDTLQVAWSKEEAKKLLEIRLGLPGGLTRLHRISHCQLPRARQMMQKRYE